MKARVRIALKRLIRLLAAIGARLCLVALGLAIALGLGEIIIRAALPQQLIITRPDIWTPVSDGLGWRHRPHVDTTVNTGERDVQIVTDGHGFRVGASPRSVREGVRILAVGDSFLEALQVEHEQTMTALIGADLSKTLGNPVRVVNTGVAGWDPNHYLIMARQELERQQYDLLLAFVFLGNDVIKQRVGHFPPRQPVTRQKLRLPRSIKRGELIDAIAYPINNVLEERSHLFQLLKARLKQPLARVGLTAAYFPKALLREHESAEAWSVTASALLEIGSLAEDHRTAAMIVLLPALIQVDEKMLPRYAESFGIDPQEVDPEQPARILTALLEPGAAVTVDATQALKAAFAAGVPVFGEVDTHLSPSGHEVVAEMLAPLLAEQFVVNGGPVPADRARDE